MVEWVIPVPVAVRPEQPPASSPLDWEWNVPSLQNEQDFYTNVMGWTIPSGEPNFDNTFTGSYSWLSASGWGFGTIHSDTEGDDLWVWDQQKKRYGSSFTVEGADTVGDWRTALLAEYKASLLSALDQGTESSQFYDHMYGQGLAVIYNDTQDPDILTVFDELRSRITGLSSYQEIISSGTTEVAHYEGRYVGRPALSAAYIAKATSDSDWITIRDNYKTAYETSPDWEEGGVIVGGGGMYFASREQASYISGSGGTAAYDAGRRFHSSFQIGIIAEVMWRMYVESGSTILRDRLIKMARYVLRYAHVPSWDYPHVGSRFGHEGDGSRWHKDTGDSTATTAAKDCSYDAGLVNLMVFGYKLTGDQELLDFARTLFTRCNRYLPGGGGAFRAASQNHLLKYMDTTPNNVQRRLQWNKGVLQYAYQVFENGGDIQTETYGGTIEALADGMSSNTWLEITSSMDNSNLKSLTLNTAGTLRSAFEYSHQFFWNSVSKELHFRGGGASSGSNAAQRHVRFGDTRGTWDAVTGWVNPGYVHQWNQFTGDPRTGNLYHRRPNNTDIIKWTYADYPATPAWTSFVQGGWGNSYNAESFEFFPDLNDGDGGFVFIETYGDDTTIWYSNAAATSWNSLANVFGASDQSIETFSCYHPGEKCILFGGGNGGPRVGRFNADATFTELGNSPYAWGGGGSNPSKGIVVGHPNGRAFAVSAQQDGMWEYIASTDTWTQSGLVNGGTLPFLDAHWMSCCMIPEHDVIYVCIQTGSGATAPLEHWLYKL